MRPLLAVLALLLLAAPAHAAPRAWIATIDGSREATTQRVLGTGAGVLGFRHLPFIAVLADDAQVAAIRRLPGVARVDESTPIRLALDESVAAIGAAQLHVEGITGEGVRIGISDSGTDGTHPDLEPGIDAHRREIGSTDDALSLGYVHGVRAEQVPLAFQTGTEAPAGRSDVADGHGTHVAGIAGGRGTSSGGTFRGVAPGSRLVVAGMGGPRVTLWQLAAWDWMLDEHRRRPIEAINNSWEAQPVDGVFVRDAGHPVEVASKHLHDEGIAVVFAAGNSGPGEGSTNVHAGWPWTITVGSACLPSKPKSADLCTGGSTSGLAADSARGTADGRVPGPDLVAPGVDIVAPWTLAGARTPKSVVDNTTFCDVGAEDLARYHCTTGTSMAAPHVTGAIALLEQASKRDLSPDELKAVLTRTADPLPGTRPHEAGAGMLDAAEAVRAVGRGGLD